MFRLQIEARLSWRVRIVMIASIALFLATMIQAQSSRPNGMPSPDPTPATPSGKTDSSDSNFGSPENEMRSRRSNTTRISRARVKFPSLARN